MNNLIRTAILIAGILSAMICSAQDSDSTTAIDEYNLIMKSGDTDPKTVWQTGIRLINLGEQKMAHELGKMLLERASITGDREKCELYGHMLVGTVISSPDAVKVLGSLEKARVIAESTKNHEALVSIYNELGIYYLFNNNDPYTASEYYYNSLEEAKSLGDDRRYGIILANLSGCYQVMNDPSGLRLAEQAYETAWKSGEKIPLYYAASSLANFYLLTDSIHKVLPYIEQAEKLHRELKMSGEADMYLMRAKLLEKEGDLDSASEMYVKAMQNFKNADVSSVSATYLGYANLLHKKGYTVNAIRVLEYGLQNAIDEKTAVHTSEMMKQLVLLYRDAGRHTDAVDMAMRYQAMQDSMFTISRQRMLQENRVRHDIYTSERLIDEQKMQLNASRHRIILLSTGLLALSVILLILWSYYRKKKRLYLAIVSQNEQFLQREKILNRELERMRTQTSADESPEQEPEIKTDTEPQNHSDKLADLMERFTVLMMQEKHFTDPNLTVQSVADELHTNRTYLSKAINDISGKTFTQIINEYRIHHAIELISDRKANYPLKQVASDVGFNSLSTFYTVFQTTTGMTPARYRDSLKSLNNPSGTEV